jgi:hypothetical protein
MGFIYVLCLIDGFIWDMISKSADLLLTHG